MSLISISSLFSNLSEYENAINAHFLYFEKTEYKQDIFAMPTSQ